MKNITLLFFALLTFSIFAQIPQGINYQAIVRDGAGEPITEGFVTVTFRVYDSGSQQYEEDHTSVEPNDFGLVNLIVGTGAKTSVLSFADIDWSQSGFKIEALVDNNSLGIQELQTVPYSFNAAVADSVSGVDLSGVGSFQPWQTGPTTTYNLLDNIGIGTSNPVSPLQIGVDFHVLDKSEVGFNCVSTNGVSDGAGSVNYQTTDGAALMVIDQNLSGFFLYPSGPAGTEVADYNMNLKVTPNGVGINTDGVSATLDMGNNTDGIILPVGTSVERPGSPEQGCFRYNSDLLGFEGYNGISWSSFGSSPWTENSGSVYRTTGGVGIGINSGVNSVQPLHVVSVRTNNINPMVIFEASGTNGSASVQMLNTAGDDFNYGVTTGGVFGISANDNPSVTPEEDFYMDSDGKVGIGTSSPSEKLDVEGSVEIDGEYKYESPATRYVSIPVASFMRHSELTTYSLVKNFTSGAPNYAYFSGGSTGASAYGTAAVYLPHNATVTNLRAVMFDNDASVEGTVGLYRVTAGSSTLMAECTAADMASIQTIDNSTIGSSVINNASYSYALRIVGDQNGGLNLRFYHVIITYTVNQAD